MEYLNLLILIHLTDAYVTLITPISHTTQDPKHGVHAVTTREALHSLLDLSVDDEDTITPPPLPALYTAALAAYQHAIAITTDRLHLQQCHQRGMQWHHEQQHTQQRQQASLSRHKKYHALRDEARRLYANGHFHNPHQAAKRLLPQILAYAKKIGQPLSPDRAQKTLYDWLRQETTHN